ncbi:MAG: 4-alpha-glucanotransferase [Lachnoclostridium sp.]|jgi:4-alpha-glucanotransferase|nr:4-alpha-glucanotransferase [Lachnoclostridium sp.]
MRRSGILLPISSLPSDYGIGALDRQAYAFIDVLKAAGQSCWQILPIGPTSYGDSPYQSFSTFAGNPYYISLDVLIGKGYLTKEECMSVDFDGHPNYIEYEKIYKGRFALLKLAYKRSCVQEDAGFHYYIEQNAGWLTDYAFFMAIKDDYNGLSYLEWEDDIRKREPEAMEKYRERLQDEIQFYMYLQYEFDNQWNNIKAYANENGIQIIGDIPIYVALDSADTWANPELFQLTDELEPIAVAGCPPDGFSALGQLWGNPLYQWDYHKETKYDWWIKRIKNCSKWYDFIRIDHFRGFDEYYSIPFGHKDAVKGHWERGPGIDIFQTLKNELGNLNIIAEDLGFLTDSVRKLLADTEFPGMKVLQFAFDTREESDYMPHNYERNCVVYTGTHDNETTKGWIENLPEWDKKVVLKYMDRKEETDPDKLAWHLICMAMQSVADLCMIPAWDYLLLGNEARMNKPSTLGDNWKWKMSKDAFTPELIQRIFSITKIYSRLT